MTPQSGRADGDASGAGESPRAFRAETLLAELNRLRQDVPKDPSDLEWLTLHHVFCFVSYQMSGFQKYVEEQRKKGAFDELAS
jgi:hypothetical protein